MMDKLLEKELMKVTMPSELWLHIPTGHDELIIFENNASQVQWTKKRRFCFCCKSTTKSKFDPNKITDISREPYSILAGIRDFFTSFVFAFLFHLVPSMIWGPVHVLGTPENHQAMGAVWFGGWVVWFILAVFMRPRGFTVEGEGFV